LVNFDILYFLTDGCINKSCTYLLTYIRVTKGRQTAIQTSHIVVN